MHGDHRRCMGAEHHLAAARGAAAREAWAQAGAPEVDGDRLAALHPGADVEAIADALLAFLAQHADKATAAPYQPAPVPADA